MTGKQHVSIVSLEELLQRPLQRVIGLLHINELPVKYVFKIGMA